MYSMRRSELEPRREMAVWPPTLVPDSNRAGVRPAKATNLRALAKRWMSPSSARRWQAVRVPMPGMLVNNATS